MHELRAVDYIATVYTMYLFQCSFVFVQNKDCNCIFQSRNHSTNVSFLVASFNAVSFSTGNYWNVTPALCGVLLYIIDKFFCLKFMKLLKYITVLSLLLSTVCIWFLGICYWYLKKFQYLTYDLPYNYSILVCMDFISLSPSFLSASVSFFYCFNSITIYVWWFFFFLILTYNLVLYLSCRVFLLFYFLFFFSLFFVSKSLPSHGYEQNTGW